MWVYQPDSMHPQLTTPPDTTTHPNPPSVTVPTVAEHTIHCGTQSKRSRIGAIGPREHTEKKVADIQVAIKENDEKK